MRVQSERFPNFASMYATRSRQVKTDKRDARTLAEANRLGAYRKAHRISDERRQLRVQVVAQTPTYAEH